MSAGPGRLITRRQVPPILLAVLLASAAALLIERGLTRIPLGPSMAIDWRGIWAGIEGGTVRYGTGLRNPPWSLLPILPLGLLSMPAGWSLMAFASIVVLILSVPQSSRRGRRILAALLLATSFSSLRQIADGNIEPLVIGGVLLLLHGYRNHSPPALAIGALLASAKPQESWLLLLVLGIFIVRSWTRRQALAAAGIVAAVVLPTLLWQGRDWWKAFTGIEHRGSIMDASLLTTLQRAGSPDALTGVLWLTLLVAAIYLAYAEAPRLSREAAGMLIAASLLLSPYAAGNSILAVLAIGTAALFLEHPWIGGGLFAILNTSYLFSQSAFMYSYGAPYASAYLLLSWGALAWAQRARGREQAVLKREAQLEKSGHG